MDPQGNNQIGAGQYMTFVLDSQDYGIPIDTVKEIIQMSNITPVPQTPEFVRGVINLRGRIIPVVDLRLKFGMNFEKITKKTCIIIINVLEDNIGVIVDSVNEVVDLKSEQIETSPNLGNRPEASFVMGIGKISKRMILLVDISEILSKEKLNIQYTKPELESLMEGTNG